LRVSEIKNINEEKADDKKKLDDDVFIAPPVPPPYKNHAIPIDSEDLSSDILKKIDNIDPNIFRSVILNCERCNKEILVSIPIDPIIKSEKRELLVVFVHKDIKKKDKHCLIFEVDHDFNILIPKASDVIISTIFTQRSETEKKKQKSSEIRYVIIKCEKCIENIHVPVPIRMIQESKIPKTPIAYIHKSSKENDPHCVILYLDENFGDRDTRFPDLLILHLFPYWLKEKYYYF
jgi:hypothetical protein